MVHMFNLLRPPCFNLPVLVNLFSSAKNCVPSTTVWKDIHVEWLFSKHYKLSFLKTYKNPHTDSFYIDKTNASNFIFLNRNGCWMHVRDCRGSSRLTLLLLLHQLCYGNIRYGVYILYSSDTIMLIMYQLKPNEKPLSFSISRSVQSSQASKGQDSEFSRY